ncbi:MAG: GatB/YqeY domain-containing protein [Gemmatimonadaceae bacterium]
MDLRARLQSDLNAARKAQDKPAVLLLGTLLADVGNRRIELARELTDDEIIDVLRRGIKKRRESLELYEKHGREDLASQERAEIALLETYLPVGASDDEIRSAIVAAIAGGAGNIGAIMKAVMVPLKGRADGSRINAIAREEMAVGS